MDAKLIIDLQKCKQCLCCTALCSYKHHPRNNGINALLEKVRFALICRKCETAPCVSACPQSALEKVPAPNGDGKVLKRATMLCTGCGTCAIACPFGTVYTELIPYVNSICDLCRSRLSPGAKPLCVTSCPYSSLEYGPARAGDDLVEVLDGVLVRVTGGTVWEPFLRESEKVKK
jgi:Fe-S-cluster-containing hydrogenase component 2